MSVAISTFLAAYGSKIIAGAAILLVRYVEKSNVVKKYQKKLDKFLKIDENENND